MTTSTSLLSKIPIPQKPNDIKVTTPLASVKVGDIEQDTPKAQATTLRLFASSATMNPTKTIVLQGETPCILHI